MATPDDNNTSSRRAAWGVPLYIAGALGAMVAAGLGWQMLEPPLPVDTTTGPLWSVLALTILPILAMGIGTAVAWGRATPQWTMLALALLTATLLGPIIGTVSADLAVQDYTVDAVVLGVYDCDRLAPDGVEAALTCVELAWTHPSGNESRDRFVIADDALDGQALARGSCAQATIWPWSQRLVRVQSVPNSQCTQSEAVDGSVTQR